MKINVKNIIITTVLGQFAWWIGWYGMGNWWILFGGIAAVVGSVIFGLVMINRWQSTGYKRVSDRVKLAKTLGQKRSETDRRYDPIK